MLAYVFWHWPADPAPAEPASYERDLAAFHAALAAAPLPGFVRSAAFRVPELPWLPAAGYEDWYQVTDWAALGALNDGAVSPPRRAPHDEVAVRSAGGAGAVYRLRGEELGIADVRSAAWFAKPRGWSYERLLAAVGHVPGLWQRQMVLGPSPEFCVRGPASVELPAGVQALACEPERVWP